MNEKKINKRINIRFLAKKGKYKKKWWYTLYYKNIFIIRKNILKTKVININNFFEWVLQKWNIFIQILNIKLWWKRKNDEKIKRIENYSLYKKSFYVKKDRFFLNYFIFWLFQYIDQLTKVPLQEYGLLWARSFFAFVTIVCTKWYLREYFLKEIFEYDKYFKFNFGNSMFSSTSFIFNNRSFSVLKLFSKVKSLRENFNFSYYKKRGPNALSKIFSFSNIWMRADSYRKSKIFNKIKEEIVKENQIELMNFSPLRNLDEIYLENKFYIRKKSNSRYVNIGHYLQKNSKFFIDYKLFLKILILRKRRRKEWKKKKFSEDKFSWKVKKYTAFKNSKKKYEDISEDQEEEEVKNEDEDEMYLEIVNKNEIEPDHFYFHPDHPYMFDDFLIKEIMEDHNKNIEDRKKEEQERKEKEKKKENEEKKKKEREEEKKKEEEEWEKKRKEENEKRKEEIKKRKEEAKKKEEEDRKREEEDKKREEEDMQKEEEEEEEEDKKKGDEKREKKEKEKRVKKKKERREKRRQEEEERIRKEEELALAIEREREIALAIGEGDNTEIIKEEGDNTENTEIIKEEENQKKEEDIIIKEEENEEKKKKKKKENEEKKKKEREEEKKKEEEEWEKKRKEENEEDDEDEDAYEDQEEEKESEEDADENVYEENEKKEVMEASKYPNEKHNYNNELYNLEEFYVEDSANEVFYYKENLFIGSQDDELTLGTSFNANDHRARWIKNLTSKIWVKQIPRIEALMFLLMWPEGIKGPSRKEEKSVKIKAKLKAKERAEWIVINKLLPKKEAKIIIENYVEELKKIKIEKGKIEREKLREEEKKKEREKEEGEFLKAVQEFDNFPERILRLEAKIKAVREIIKEANVDFKWIGEIVADLEINETVKYLFEKVKLDSLKISLEKVQNLERVEPWRVIYKEAVKQKVITFLENEIIEKREKVEEWEKVEEEEKVDLYSPIFLEEGLKIKKKKWETAREEEKKKLEEQKKKEEQERKEKEKERENLREEEDKKQEKEDVSEDQEEEEMKNEEKDEKTIKKEVEEKVKEEVKNEEKDEKTIKKEVEEKVKEEVKNEEKVKEEVKNEEKDEKTIKKEVEEKVKEEVKNEEKVKEEVKNEEKDEKTIKKEVEEKVKEEVEEKVKEEVQNEIKTEKNFKRSKYFNIAEELLFPHCWIYKGKKYVINSLEDYREVYNENYAEKAMDNNEYWKKKVYKKLLIFYKPFKKLWGKRGLPFFPLEEKLRGVFIKNFGGEWIHLQKFFLEQFLRKWVFITPKKKEILYSMNKRKSLNDLESLKTLKEAPIFPLTWELYFNKIFIREEEGQKEMKAEEISQDIIKEEEFLEYKSERAEVKYDEAFKKWNKSIEVDTKQGIESTSIEVEIKEAFNNNFIEIDKGLLSEEEWNKRYVQVFNKYLPAIKGWGKWSRKSLKGEIKKVIGLREREPKKKKDIINKISFHKILEKVFFPHPSFFYRKRFFYNLIKNGDESINEEFKKDYISKYQKKLLKGGIVEKKGDQQKAWYKVRTIKSIKRLVDERPLKIIIDIKESLTFFEKLYKEWKNVKGVKLEILLKKDLSLFLIPPELKKSPLYLFGENIYYKLPLHGFMGIVKDQKRIEGLKKAPLSAYDIIEGLKNTMQGSRKKRWYEYGKEIASLPLPQNLLTSKLKKRKRIYVKGIKHFIKCRRLKKVKKLLKIKKGLVKKGKMKNRYLKNLHSFRKRDKIFYVGETLNKTVVKNFREVNRENAFFTKGLTTKILEKGKSFSYRLRTVFSKSLKKKNRLIKKREASNWNNIKNKKLNKNNKNDSSNFLIENFQESTMNNMIKLIEMSKKENPSPNGLKATSEEPDLYNVTNFLIESLKESSNEEKTNEEKDITNALIESLKETKSSLNKIKSSNIKKNEGIKRKEMSKNKFLIKNIKEMNNSIKKKEIKNDKIFLNKSVGVRSFKRVVWTNFFNKTLSFSNFSLIYVNKFKRISTSHLKFSRKSKNVYYKNMYPKKKFKKILKKINRKKEKDKWPLTFKQKETIKKSFWRVASWRLHMLWRSIGRPKINKRGKVNRNNSFNLFKWYMPSILPYTCNFIKEFSILTTLNVYKKLYFNKLYFYKYSKKGKKKKKNLSRKELLFFHKFFIQIFKFSSIFKFFENSLWLINYPFYTLFRTYKAKWLNQLIKIGIFFREERKKKKGIKKKKGRKNILNLIFSQRVFRKNYKKGNLLSKGFQKIKFYKKNLWEFSVEPHFLLEKMRVRTRTRTRGILLNPKGNYNLCLKGNLTNKKNKKEYDFTYENFRGKFNKNKKKLLLLLKGEWHFSELMFSSRNPLLIYFRNIHTSSLFFHTGCISIKNGRKGDESVLKKDKLMFFGRSGKGFIKNSKKIFNLGGDYSSMEIFITTLIWGFLNNATKKKIFLYRDKRLPTFCSTFQPFFFKKWKYTSIFSNFYFNRSVRSK